MDIKITTSNYNSSPKCSSMASKEEYNKISTIGENEPAIIYDQETSFSSNNLYSIQSIRANANTTLTNQEVQSGLSTLGLYKGPIDGNLTSSASKQAIKNFQQVYCDTHNAGTMTDKMKTKLLGLLRFRRTLINDSKFNQTAKELSLDSTEKSNLATIWTFLRKRMGLSASQAAGVCGNLSFESHFSTDNLQDINKSRVDHDPNYKYNSSDGKGYGLMQWSEETEKKKLLQTANNMNLNVSDLNAQLAHFQEEMTSGIYRNKWPKLKQKTSTKDVCDYFESAMEGAGEAHLDKREKDANILYKYLKDH